jgi:transcriptional regulator with XRE-family HTH domain
MAQCNLPSLQRNQLPGRSHSWDVGPSRWASRSNRPTLTFTAVPRQTPYNPWRGSPTNRAHIGNVETNSRPPSLLFVLRIARLFGITTDYLLRDTIPIEVAANHTVTDPSDQTALPMLFGAKLRQLRRQHALAQTELATQLSLANNAHISLLERGHHEPSIDLVVAIADYFGVSTDYLLWDSTPIE